MKTLLLYCQDPCFPARAPWNAFASFDYAFSRNLDVVFDMPFGRLGVVISARDAGGTVTAQGQAVSIDLWDNVISNFLRLRGIMSILYAATVAEGLSRLAPLLDAAGSGQEVTECLVKNL